MRHADLRVAVSVLVMLMVGLVPEMGAHRLDEYLQAARIAVSTDQIVIELDLTPGESMAASVVRAIDGNRDGTASAEEGRDYAQRILSDTALEVDGASRRLVLLRSQVADLDAMRAGVGTVHLEIGAGRTPRTSGAHRLRFRNTHRADVGVYLANALTPATPRIRITDQRRDVLQQELQLSYEVLQPASVRWPSWWVLSLTGAFVGASGLMRRHRRR